MQQMNSGPYIKKSHLESFTLNMTVLNKIIHDLISLYLTVKW